MKKIFIFLMSTLTLFVYGQEKKEKTAHWSLTVETGINRFDGDITQKDKAIDPTSTSKLITGGSLEYTLTPVWSIGVEYYNLPLKAVGSYYTLTDKMNTADLFFSFNLIKWFYSNSHSRWGFWATLGGGAALYDVNYQTTKDGNVDNHGNVDADYVHTNCWALTVPVGTLIEYNISKNLALGAKIQYRAYNKDNLDGRNFYGVTNDFVLMSALQLRWKFNALNNAHTRNINTNTFNEIIAPVQRPKTNPDVLKSQVDSLQNELDGVKSQLEKLGKMTTEAAAARDKSRMADSLQNEVRTGKNTIIDSDEDGVPDDRDLEPNTPKGHAVDFYGREIKSTSDINGYAVVFFDFDKYDLDDEAHAAIKKVADKMKKDQTLTVEVRGYCDYLGSVAYNDKLSQLRANVVTQELVEKYGIGRYRIIANGKGRLPEPQTAFRENRRCNFFFDR